MPHTKVVELKKGKFASLNILLWLHGFGFTMKRKWTYKYVAHFIISLFLLLITDGALLQSSVLHIKFMLFTSSVPREKVALGLISALELILRVLIHVKRRTLNVLMKRTARIYASVSISDSKFIKYLPLILAFNDAFIICKCLMYYVTIKYTLFFDTADFNHLAVFPPPYSTVTYHVSMFIAEWGSMTYIFPVYFCSLCFIMEKTLEDFNEMATESRKPDCKFLFDVYSKISKLVSTFNQVIHDILFLTFVILLVRLFYSSYLVLFKANPKVAFRCIAIVSSFTRFHLMCCFASSVTKAADKAKVTLFDMPVTVREKSENVRFMLKMNGTSVGFKLLDSLVIDRNLVLSAVGTLLTYGIMIATFNGNSTP